MIPLKVLLMKGFLNMEEVIQREKDLVYRLAFAINVKKIKPDGYLSNVMYRYERKTCF